MTVLRLARSELKRMTGGLLPKLTILALTMVPLLYGAVYLYANWDPYGNLNQIDAALVVEDTGATSSDGTRAAGRQEGGRQPGGRPRLQLEAGLQRRGCGRRCQHGRVRLRPADPQGFLRQPGLPRQLRRRQPGHAARHHQRRQQLPAEHHRGQAHHRRALHGGQGSGRGNRQPAPHRFRHHPCVRS